MNSTQRPQNEDQQIQTLHVCLISNQILPNLIPALTDKNIAGVISFSGDGSTTLQRNTLEKLLNRHKIDVIKKVSAKKSFDLPVLREKAQELRAWLEKHAADKTWKINLTGGTKPMSLALYREFAENRQADFIYQDTQSRLLRNLEDETRNEPNRSVIDIPTYLAAQGFWISSSATAHQDDIDHLTARRYLLNKVFKPILHKAWLLTSVFNRPASTAADEKNSLTQSYNPDKKSRFDPKPEAEKYIEILEQEGLLTWNKTQRTFTFYNRESAQFLGGGWLEEYTYWAAVEAGIDHVSMGVFGKWQKTSNNGKVATTNEFDVVLCHNNQLMIIECKALAFNREQKGQDIVNKIEALGKLAGGLYGKSMLLSADAITKDNQYTSHVYSRIKDYRIELVERSELRNLQEKLTEWKTRCESSVLP